MLSEREGPVKKPFKTPELVVYGDILEITQAVGNMGVSDGGTKGAQKTGK